MTAAIALFVTAPLVILFVGALVAELPFSEQVPDLLRALAGGVLLSAVLAGLSLLIAATTPRRGLGVAAVITVLLVLAGVHGAAQEIALSEGADTAAAYLGLVSPFTLVDGVQSAVFGADSILVASPSGAAAGAVFAGVTVALILATFAGLVLRYRKVSVS